MQWVLAVGLLKMVCEAFALFMLVKKTHLQ